MRTRLFLLMISMMCFISSTFSQDTTALSYFGQDYFLLEGTAIADTLKENRYDRLPKAHQALVREPVWQQSKASAGLSIRFSSNTTRLSVKWTLMNNMTMNHMAETGIKGIDLYYNNKGTWQYLNTARPSGLENEYKLISHMPTELREYKMYLPLYDGLLNIEVGIDSTSTISKGEVNTQKPIVFYGTSITQGGCASRPGMAHTNIISRKLNTDCINFGFSGNGKMETPIVELMTNIDAAFYVVECLPNMTKEEVHERTIPLVELIRKQRPATPIILVDNFMYEPTALDTTMSRQIQQINAALKKEYSTLIDEGYKHLYFINSMGATGNDHEGVVDGVHFTDLGFKRYADFLLQHFKQFGIVERHGD